MDKFIRDLGDGEGVYVPHEAVVYKDVEGTRHYYVNRQTLGSSNAQPDMVRVARRGNKLIVYVPGGSAKLNARELGRRAYPPNHVSITIE